MQYKPETEKLAMVGGSYQPVIRPLSLVEDREVQRTRKIFMIILGVLFAFSIAGLVGALFESGTHRQAIYGGQSSQLSQAIVSMLFYGFGLFAAHRYSTLGLRIFGWLCIISLVVVGIAIIALIFFAIAAASAVSNVDNDTKTLLVVGSVAGSILLILVVGMCVLTVIIVKFAFKLARVIDANKRLAIQEI